MLNNCLKSLLLLNCQNRVALLLRWLHLLTTLISLNLLATVFCRELFLYSRKHTPPFGAESVWVTVIDTVIVTVNYRGDKCHTA